MDKKQPTPVRLEQIHSFDINKPLTGIVACVLFVTLSTCHLWPCIVQCNYRQPSVFSFLRSISAGWTSDQRPSGCENNHRIEFPGVGSCLEVYKNRSARHGKKPGLSWWVFTGYAWRFTVYARVTHGLPKTRFLWVLWVVNGFWTGFYGVWTGFLRVFTVCLRVVDGFLLFQASESVKKCSKLNGPPNLHPWYYSFRQITEVQISRVRVGWILSFSISLISTPCLNFFGDQIRIFPFFWNLKVGSPAQISKHRFQIGLVEETRIFPRFSIHKWFNCLWQLFRKARAPIRRSLEVVDDRRDAEAKEVRVDPGQRPWQLMGKWIANEEQYGLSRICWDDLGWIYVQIVKHANPKSKPRMKYH